jgi:hypothetical protein
MQNDTIGTVACETVITFIIMCVLCDSLLDFMFSMKKVLLFVDELQWSRERFWTLQTFETRQLLHFAHGIDLDCKNENEKCCDVYT